jgi:hypothetical protein
LREEMTRRRTEPGDVRTRVREAEERSRKSVPDLIKLYKSSAEALKAKRSIPDTLVLASALDVALAGEAFPRLGTFANLHHQSRDGSGRT